MDLATRKLHLIEKFMNIASLEKVEQLEHFFNTELQQDEEVELPEMVVKLLDKSRQDSKAGRVRPHEEVMKEVRQKYNLR